MLKCTVVDRNDDEVLVENSRDGEDLLSLAGRVMTELSKVAHPRHLEWYFRHVKTTPKVTPRKWDGRRYHHTLSLTTRVR